MHKQFGEARSALRYFEELAKQRALDPAELEAQGHRRTLYALMTAVGFTSYYPEFWHFQTGHQMDAYFKNEPTTTFGYAGDAYPMNFWNESLRAGREYRTMLINAGVPFGCAHERAHLDFGFHGAPPMPADFRVLGKR